jgi:hypothetical protein
MATVTNRLLWWCLVVSLLIYVVMAHVASPRMNPDAPAPLLMAVLATLSLGIAVGTLLYRRHALAGPIQRGALDLTNPRDQAKAFQAFIISLVLSESVGIYGLVLAFLSGRGAYSIPFVLAALALMYAHRPTAPDLQSPLSGASFEGRPPPIG